MRKRLVRQTERLEEDGQQVNELNQNHHIGEYFQLRERVQVSTAGPMSQLPKDIFNCLLDFTAFWIVKQKQKDKKL